MNSVFNIKRFWAYLKREIVVNPKRVYIPAGLMTVLFGAFLLVKFAAGDSGDGVVAMNSLKNAAESLTGFLGFGGAALVLIYTSQISNCFAQKTSCTDFLTVPASMLEKYVSKIVVNFIIPTTLYAAMFGYTMYSWYKPDTLTAWLAIIAALVFVSGIFLFWGALFRRVAAMWAVSAITALVLLIYHFRFDIDRMNLMFLDPWRVYFNGMSDAGVAGFFNIVAAVFFIISAVIGYFIYRRKQQIVKPFNR
ncbi:MAG: hypothetical protein IKQ30_04600 [Bacteroidales bacterium]|nr:hypothetical protein [Bacteroidales bacterium]MBR4272097.1 hypothetical protein [Bacteroidales bacterium]